MIGVVALHRLPKRALASLSLALLRFSRPRAIFAVAMSLAEATLSRSTDSCVWGALLGCRSRTVNFLDARDFGGRILGVAAEAGILAMAGLMFALKDSLGSRARLARSGEFIYSLRAWARAAASSRRRVAPCLVRATSRTQGRDRYGCGFCATTLSF